MVKHGFANHGPMGGKAAFMGVPYWKRGEGNINPRDEYDQFRMLQDYRAGQRKPVAPVTGGPGPALDPNTPVAQAAAPMAAPVAAEPMAAGGLADTVVPQKSSTRTRSGSSRTRKVRTGNFGGGGSGGAFGGGFF